MCVCVCVWILLGGMEGRLKAWFPPVIIPNYGILDQYKLHFLQYTTNTIPVVDVQLVYDEEKTQLFPHQLRNHKGKIDHN